MPTVYTPLDRRAHYTDHDYLPTFVQHEDEVINYVIDWTDLLNGETISTSTWTDDGVTSSSAAISGATTSANITDTDGEVENKITTSGSRTLIRRLRFRAPQWADKATDYGR